jgi:hypothetical protein
MQFLSTGTRHLVPVFILDVCINAQEIFCMNHHDDFNGPGLLRTAKVYQVPCSIWDQVPAHGTGTSKSLALGLSSTGSLHNI